jgi:flagellar assembly factor FliW
MIELPAGLVGCPTWKRFVLKMDDEDAGSPVGALQCLDDTQVVFLVTDPQILLPGYSAPLTPEERTLLEFRESEQPVLYCTLTVGDQDWITANLVGPLAINPRTGRGVQLVLANSSYSTVHPVARLADSGEGEAQPCSS